MRTTCVKTSSICSEWAKFTVFAHRRANAAYNIYVYKTDLGQQPLCIQRSPRHFRAGNRLVHAFRLGKKLIAFWQWAAKKKVETHSALSSRQNLLCSSVAATSGNWIAFWITVTAHWVCIGVQAHYTLMPFKPWIVILTINVFLVTIHSESVHAFSLQAFTTITHQKYARKYPHALL